MHEFKEWPKTMRLFRDIVVTEKIDGTNSALHITPVAEWEADLVTSTPGNTDQVVKGPDDWWVLSAQSRKRLIYPGKSTDNFGFAAWAYDNAAELVSLLGMGVHYGEWWGRGIQRGYGRENRSFSLFNTDRYPAHADGWSVGGVDVAAVPVLYRGINDTERVRECLRTLRDGGSVAAPGFARPEGVCVFHSATRTVTKATLDNNDRGKWEGEAA